MTTRPLSTFSNQNRSASLMRRNCSRMTLVNNSPKLSGVASNRPAGYASILAKLLLYTARSRLSAYSNNDSYSRSSCCSNCCYSSSSSSSAYTSTVNMYIANVADDKKRTNEDVKSHINKQFLKDCLSHGSVATQFKCCEILYTIPGLLEILSLKTFKQFCDIRQQFFFYF